MTLRKDKMCNAALENGEDGSIVCLSETFEKRLEKHTLAVFSNLDNSRNKDCNECRSDEHCVSINPQDCDPDG